MGGLEDDHRSSIGGQAIYTAVIRPGLHEVRVRYPGVPNATQRAEYIIRQGEQRLGRVILNQRRGADEWISLGRYMLSGFTATITVATDPGQRLIADAVEVEPRPVPWSTRETLVDDGGPLHLEGGVWNALGDGYDGDSRSSQDDGAYSTWQFAGISPDFYEVLVRYPVHPDNAQSAEYVISDDTGILQRQVLDQSAAAGGWQSIGTVRTHASVLKVTLSRLAGGGRLTADAVKLVSTACVECAR